MLDTMGKFAEPAAKKSEGRPFWSRIVSLLAAFVIAWLSLELLESWFAWLSRDNPVDPTISLEYGQPITEIIRSELPKSLLLLAASLILAWLILTANMGARLLLARAVGFDFGSVYHNDFWSGP